MPQLLEIELETYERHRDELLGNSEGKYVLIRGTEIVDIFDSRSDAINKGYERFGNVPFLVKHIVKVEIPENFVSNLLAV